MAQAASELQITGVSVFGPPPLGWVHIPLEPGVIALYGKNGVGKTRLLSAVTDALRGVRGIDAWGMVHLQVPDPSNLYSLPWRTQFEEALKAHYGEMRGATLAHIVAQRDAGYDDEIAQDEANELLFDFTMSVENEDYSPTSVEELVRAHLYQLPYLSEALKLDEDYVSLVSTVADRGLFTLLATGTLQQPAWEAYAAGTMNMAAVAELINGDRERIRAFRQAAPQFLDVDTPTKENQQGLLELLQRLGPIRPSGYPWDKLEPFRERIVANIRPFQDGSIGWLGDSWTENWPQWCPIPLWPVGTISDLPLRVLGNEPDLCELNARTRDYLLQACSGRVFDVASDEEIEFNEVLTAARDAIVERSNDLIRDVLECPPKILFNLGKPVDWFAGKTPEWVLDTDKGPAQSIAGASKAQLRWIGLAATLAREASDTHGRSVFFLCDEPEAGLHRQIEERLPATLSRVARESSAVVLVATHSASMLDEASVNAIHITSANGYAVGREVPPVGGDEIDRGYAAQALGLTPSAMLQMIRVFVIVEGTHDELVLNRLLGEDLGAARAVVCKMGGAATAPQLAEASILFDFTDARMVVVLDNLAQELVLPTWRRAVELASNGQLKQAIAEVARLEKLDGWEARWMRDLLERAIRNGKWDRLIPAPLGQPDIICYLPAGAFVPGADWPALISEWRSAYRGRPKDLKGWLRGTYKASVGRHAVERALRTAGPPEELTRLGHTIRAASISGIADV